MTGKRENISKIKKKTGIALFWIVIWQVVAVIVNNPVYFAGPIETIMELTGQWKTISYWQAIGGSTVRILFGFLLASITGYMAAYFAGQRKWLSEILVGPVNFFQSVPVAAVVVILLIWFGSKTLSLYITFMVVFPNIYRSALEGFTSADRKLSEVAEVFSIDKKDRFRYIYKEAAGSNLRGSIPFCIGMSFKSGIAAEIIGVSAHSIGERLYVDKITLNTAGVFAWMISILLLSALVEKGLLFVLAQAEKNGLRLEGQRERTFIEDSRTKDDRKEEEDDEDTYPGIRIEIEKLSASYEEKPVWKDLTHTFEEGKIHCIYGESGIGKTTLLRILAGLEQADEGKVIWKAGTSDCDRPSIGMCFQENRLFERHTALKNLEISGSSGCARTILKETFAVDTFGKPVRTYSGGMKRRLALIRTLLSKQTLLLLDEPFTGLDEETKKQTIGWIGRYRKGRTVLLVTHDPQDARDLGAETFSL